MSLSLYILLAKAQIQRLGQTQPLDGRNTVCVQGGMELFGALCADELPPPKGLRDLAWAAIRLQFSCSPALLFHEHARQAATQGLCSENFHFLDHSSLV